MERILSLLLNTLDWRVWRADSCVLVCSQLPGTAPHGSNTSETWDMTLQWHKRAPWFWRSAEGAILLVLGHQGSISLPSHERRPKAELPCPSEDGQPTKQAHQVLRGVLSPSPQSWLCVTYFCNTPTWAARKPRS